MARLFPSLQSHHPSNSGEHAEIELLQILERGLSDAYTLFHSVDWSRGGLQSHEQHGEIDVVVINQAGDVLLIEVKSGDLEFGDGAIFKTYQGKAKNITRQVGLQYGAMRSRLDDAGLQVQLHHLLVLPDIQVQSETAQWPRERIVDSSDISQIVTRIHQLLGPGAANTGLRERVMSFFSNRFQVQVDVSALSGRLQQASTVLSSGLATWVPRIKTPGRVLRVVGTAGSGKTQLALRLLNDANAQNMKTAYLCFNRALADHIARVAPVRTTSETFHEFALRVVKRSGGQTDFSQPNAFDTLTSTCIDLLKDIEPDLDLLVVDEMQDFKPEWVEALFCTLKEDGKAVLMEDPEQQLYKDRIEFDIEEAVTVTCQENFRTPRALVQLINMLQLTKPEVEALSAHTGEVPDPIIYDSAEHIERRTVEAVNRCLKCGFALEDIAIVSMRGREHSVLQNLDALGEWPLKKWNGRYDEGNNAIWTNGSLLIESVRRFKGQAAPAVVLTECDFSEMSALNKKLLFVGLTRARMHLEWVMSRATEAAISSYLKHQ